MKKLFFLFAAICIAVSAMAAEVTYEKVKAAPADDDWSGTYILVCEVDAENAKVWNGEDKGGGAGYVTATIAEDKITGEFQELEVAEMDGGYSVSIGVDSYIGCTSSESEIKIGTKKRVHTIEFVSEEENPDWVKMTCAEKVLTFNWHNASDKDRFRYYKSGSWENYYKVQLYKKCIPATSISINETVATIKQYREIQLTTTVEPATATSKVEWSVVSGEAELPTYIDGMFMLLGQGEVTIRATIDDQSDEISFTVIEPTILKASQAAEMALALEGEFAMVEGGCYVVEAFITGPYSPEPYDAENKVAYYWLADAAGTDKTLLLNAVPCNSKEEMLKVGTKVRVVGSLFKEVPEESEAEPFIVPFRETPVTVISKPTSLAPAEAPSISVANGRICGSEDMKIYNLEGQDVTLQNGSLRGAYVVRVGEQEIKVLVK